MSWNYKMERLDQLIKLGISYYLRLRKPYNMPLQYTIEPTNLCNFQCKFCRQSDPDHRKVRNPGFLEPEKLKEILARLRTTKAANEIINLTLDGEPLLNRKFIELIKIVHKYNYQPRFSSNGSMLNETISDQLAKEGNFIVSIDFSYDREVFESIRGRKGDFDIIKDNLNYFISKIKDREDIILEMHDITSYVKKEPDWLKKFESIFDEIPSNMVIHQRDFHNFGGHIDSQIEKGQYHLCPYPWTQMAITYDGNVVACCRDTDAQTILGNIFHQKFIDIWHGEKYQQFRDALIRKRPQEIKACTKCDMPWNTSKEKFKLSYLIRKLFER